MFSYETLYQKLDACRQEKKLSWRGLSGSIQMAPSTFTRIKQGKTIRTDSLDKVLEFLGMKFEDFTKRGKR